MSEHYKPLESGEGIGSYASKVAAAGLGPLPNPRLVVEYHPLVRLHTPLDGSGNLRPRTSKHAARKITTAGAFPFYMLLGSTTGQSTTGRYIPQCCEGKLEVHTSWTLTVQVSKARMDRNVAAGYDPDAEWGSDSILAGQDITDLGDEEEEAEEQELQGAAGGPSSSSASFEEADDGDLPEAAFEESDEVCTRPLKRHGRWHAHIS